MDGTEKKAVLRAAMITAFVTTFMGSSLNLSIPAMERDFEVSGALVGWVVNAFTMSVAAMSVPFGRVADITGRRRVFMTGVAGFGIISFLCMFSPDITVLLALRVFQGAAAAMIFATNNAILISVYPADQRGKVLGLSTAATYIGLSTGPVIGGFLNHYFNWHSIFAAAFAVSAAAFAVGYRSIPSDDERRGRLKPDITGSILYITAVTVSLYGLSNLSKGVWAWMMLAAGLFAGAVFFISERKKEQPLIKTEMFTADPVFTLSNIAALLNYGATFAISYLVSIYLQIIMGFSSGTAGLILICMPLTQAVFSPVMGRLSDRIKAYKLATAGMALCVAALVMFTFLSEDTDLWFVTAALLTAGFGFSLFASPNTNAIMERVDGKDYGIANSIVATMRTYGQSASMGIVSIVMGLILGSLSMEEASPSQLISTMRTAFCVFTILCVAAVFMSAFRGRHAKKAENV